MARKLRYTYIFLFTLIVIQKNVTVLCDDDSREDCDDSGEDAQGCPLATFDIDCDSELRKCCQLGQQLQNYEPVCIYTSCYGGWSAQFNNICDMIYFKCKKLSRQAKNIVFEELYFRTPRYYCRHCGSTYYNVGPQRLENCDSYPDLDIETRKKQGDQNNDTQNPIINFIPDYDIVKTTDEGQPTAVVTWNEITAQDNSGQVTLTSNKRSGDSFPIGTTKVSYTATDSSGNIAKDSFTVIVKDKENPNIVSNLDVINKRVFPGQKTKVVFWKKPAITDNSGENVKVESNKKPGDVFRVGLTHVTYSATDPSGNAADFSFDILITDVTESEKPTPSWPVCNCVNCELEVKLSAQCQNTTAGLQERKCVCKLKPPMFPKCLFPERFNQQ